MFPFQTNTSSVPNSFGNLAKPQIYDLVVLLTSTKSQGVKASVSKGKYRSDIQNQEMDDEIYGKGTLIRRSINSTIRDCSEVDTYQF